MRAVLDQLVLSLFPGIGLLDMAFEEEGFTVVRGPDLLWGGDIRRFHPPAGKFDGVIGGPPCQAFSRLVHIIRAKGQTPAVSLIPEFERVVREAEPTWFLMENVVDAPEPCVPEYFVQSHLLNNRWFGEEQNRERRFSFGAPTELSPLAFDLAALEHVNYERAVVATSSKEGALAKSQEELARGTSPRMAAMAHRRTLPGQQPRRTIARCAELPGPPRELLGGRPIHGGWQVPSDRQRGPASHGSRCGSCRETCVRSWGVRASRRSPRVSRDWRCVESGWWCRSDPWRIAFRDSDRKWYWSAPTDKPGRHGPVKNLRAAILAAEKFVRSRAGAPTPQDAQK